MTDEEFRAIVSLWGVEKVGKSHCALTFPPPIHYINLDYGIASLLPKFNFAPEDFILHNFEATDPFSVTEILGEEPKAPKMRKVLKIYGESLKACRDAGGGTVVWDTYTQGRQLIADGTLEVILEKKREEMVRKGKDPDNAQLFPFDYNQANETTGNVIRFAAQVPGVNLVLIHRASPVYDEKGHETTQVKMQGWHGVGAAVEVTIQLTQKRVLDSKTQKFKLERWGKIESARADDTLAGYEWRDPDFESLKGLLS